MTYLAEQVKKRFEQKYKEKDTPWTWGDIPYQVKKFAAETRNKLNGPRMLDLGCGDGWISIYFAKQGFKIEGIDSSKTAINKARQEAKKQKLGDVKFIHGDALDFPFPQQYFDIVFDRGFFHHLPQTEWRKYIRGVKKVLRADGYFYLIVFSDKSNIPKRKKDKLWVKEKDSTGYWTYNHYFNFGLIEKIFGRDFKIISVDEDKKPQPGGAMTLYLTSRRI